MSRKTLLVLAALTIIVPWQVAGCAVDGQQKVTDENQNGKKHQVHITEVTCSQFELHKLGQCFPPSEGDTVEVCEVTTPYEYAIQGDENAVDDFPSTCRVEY